MTYWWWGCLCFFFFFFSQNGYYFAAVKRQNMAELIFNYYLRTEKSIWIFFSFLNLICRINECRLFVSFKQVVVVVVALQAEPRSCVLYFGLWTHFTRMLSYRASCLKETTNKFRLKNHVKRAVISNENANNQISLIISVFFFFI